MSLIGNTSNFTKCSDVYKLGGVETLLRLILHEIFRQNAVDGMKLVTDEYEGDFYGFIPRDSTVVSQLTINGESVLADYGIDGETLESSDPAIMSPTDSINGDLDPFDYIKLSGGSVWVLLKLTE